MLFKRKKSKTMAQEDKDIQEQEQYQQNVDNGGEAGQEAAAQEQQGADTEFQSQYEDMRDRFLRVNAEFDNYRKRMQREKAEQVALSNRDIILKVLPVLDDMDRALSAQAQGEPAENAVEGFKLIHTKFARILRDAGLEEIEAVGKDFDPDVHEAITTIPAPNKEMKGKVVDQIEKGYMLNGRIIRHSRVVVGE